jgi:ribose transport system substrate-binding protein
MLKSVRVVALFAVAVASCIAQAASPASPQAAPKPAAVKSYTIGIALASATNPLYINLEKGMKEKANELGVKVRTVIANEDQTRQVNGIQDLITSKVDLLLISPITVQGAAVAYENAKQAKIPAISVARFLNKPDLEASIVSIDSVKDGRSIGEWMANKLNGKGRVAMLKGPAGASFAMDLEKGFKEVIGRYPNIKIVGEVNSPLTKEDGLKHSENFLTANPQLDAIFAANDELALGAVQAAESAGRLSKIAITGYNGVPSALQSIRAGKLSMTVLLGAESWGKLAMQTAVDYLNGKQVPKQVFFQPIVVDTENISKLKPEQLK